MQAAMGSESEVADNSSAASAQQPRVVQREKDQRSELDMDAKTQADVPKDEIVATAVHTRRDGTKQIYFKVRAPDGAIKMMKSQDFPDREAVCLFWEKHLKFDGDESEAFIIQSETE